MWSHTAKKSKMNTGFFNTFSPAYMKLNMSGWEVKIHMLFHVSFPSCKMCGFGHLGRCLITLCSHQEHSIKRDVIVSTEMMWMCGWKELQETGTELGDLHCGWSSKQSERPGLREDWMLSVYSEFILIWFSNWKRPGCDLKHCHISSNVA